MRTGSLRAGPHVRDLARFARDDRWPPGLIETQKRSPRFARRRAPHRHMRPSASVRPTHPRLRKSRGAERQEWPQPALPTSRLSRIRQHQQDFRTGLLAAVSTRVTEAGETAPNGTPPATPTVPATAARPPDDAALWRRRPRAPSIVSHELLDGKHKSSILAGIAGLLPSDTGSHDARRPGYLCGHGCGSRPAQRPRTCCSPISGSAASSTVGRSGRIGRRPCFGAAAGVVDALAGGPIRRDLQAHRATARVAEQPPASTPVSLPERTRSTTPAGGVSVTSAPQWAKRQLTNRGPFCCNRIRVLARALPPGASVMPSTKEVVPVSAVSQHGVAPAASR